MYQFITIARCEKVSQLFDLRGMKTEVDNAKIKTSHKSTDPRSKTQMGFWNEETQQTTHKELNLHKKKSLPGKFHAQKITKLIS